MESDLSRQAERTQGIVREDGNGMPRPSNVRCKAKKGTGQCTEEITYDKVGDYWSKFCEDHHAQDQEARKTGEPRVKRK